MIKKLFSKLGVVFFLVTFLFSTCNVNVITYADDTGMRDISGLDFVKDMKVGWNLGNTFDAGNETDWGNPVTTHAMIDEIKKEGFNTLRLPVSWYKHIGSAPTYTIDSAYMSRVEEVVKYAFDNNMYVILNIHHDNTWIVPTYAHEAQTEDELTKVWTQIANHFQSYNDHLVFEAMNEPRPVGAANEWSGGSYENRDVINKFNATAVKAIRATGGNNTKRFIMVPTIAACDQSVALNDFVLPNDSRLIVSLHLYTPYYFAMSINESGSTSTWGSDSDKAAMNSELDIIYNKFVRNGQAVVIGEFGSINKSNESSRVAHAKYFAQAATSRGITPIWWDNGIATANTAETFAIFNRNSLSWYFPDIAKAFVDGTTTTPTATPTVTPKPTAIPTVTPKPTAVPTVTPKPTAVPTVTPKPTTVPTVTPTPTTTAGNIQVKMFNGTTGSSSNAINPKFILTNTG
ncbi:MAG: glycoside hydrolase family 5 protein, partial [Bacillota bacterium]|nr:glycoside hydrolase family 5 protein [Bacillota bacterium]